MRTLLFLALSSVALNANAGDFQINPSQRLLEAHKRSLVSIGSTVSGLAFRDASGETCRIEDQKATAFVFLSTSCPLAKRYTQRLNRLHKEFSRHGVKLVGVFSNAEDTRAAVIDHAEDVGFSFPADTSGVARKLDAADPGPGYTRFGGLGFEPVSGVGGWAPGAAPAPAPAGSGFWLPKGADIVMQVHYYRTGREEKDRTKLGLYFTKSPDPKKIHMGIAINPKFSIPAGDANHQVEAVWEVEEDIYAISIGPHMHLLGKQMKVEAHLPDGSTKPMVWIKDWDFNWQGSYRYREPMLLSKGTRDVAAAHFDNSADNPNNPNSPPKPVTWGEKTTDEMCIAFIAHLKAKDWQPQSKLNSPRSPTAQVAKH